MQICMELGLNLANYSASTRAEEDRKQIANSAISIWDGTHRDAEVVVSLLREIARLRTQGRETNLADAA